MVKRKQRGEASRQTASDRPTPPRGSRITCHGAGRTTTFNIPAAANSAAVTPIAISLFGSVLLGIVSAAAWFNAAEWQAWLILGPSWIAILWLFSFGLSQLHRSGEVVVSPTSLLVRETGLVSSRSRTWQKADILRIDALPSGVAINDQPVLELAVIGHDDRRFGAFSFCTEDEVRWLARCIRQALDIPTPEQASASNDPNARGYFILTRFPVWKPGEEIHVSTRPAPAAAMVIGALIFALCGGLLGYFGASLAGRFIAMQDMNLWASCAAGALLAATLGCVFVSGSLPAREIRCTWGDRTLMVMAGGRSQTLRLQDIECLKLADVVRKQRIHDGRAERSEYLARLDARLPAGDVLLLSTEHWELTAGAARRELKPLAEAWATALGVPLEDIGEQPHRVRWRLVWQQAAPWTRWLLAAMAAL